MHFHAQQHCVEVQTCVFSCLTLFLHPCMASMYKSHLIHHCCACFATLLHISVSLSSQLAPLQVWPRLLCRRWDCSLINTLDQVSLNTSNRICSSLFIPRFDLLKVPCRHALSLGVVVPLISTSFQLVFARFRFDLKV